jgi:hypothetical protein
MPANLKTVTDNVDSVVRNITELSQQRLLVGIPDTEAGRTSGAVSNAFIGYAMEFGLPDKNVPARPFLLPTVKAMQGDITTTFRRMGERAVNDDAQGALRLMKVLGQQVADKVRGRITAGIPPPLAQSTIEGRLRRTQAGRTMLKGMRKKGADVSKWGANNLTPLIDTGQLRRSITYVIRKDPPQLWTKPR